MSDELCIRHLRIPVATIITMLAQGQTTAQILQFYPDLEKTYEALQYAAESVREKEILLKKAG